MERSSRMRHFMAAQHQLAGRLQANRSTLPLLTFLMLRDRLLPGYSYSSDGSYRVCVDMDRAAPSNSAAHEGDLQPKTVSSLTTRSSAQRPK